MESYVLYQLPTPYDGARKRYVVGLLLSLLFHSGIGWLMWEARPVEVIAPTLLVNVEFIEELPPAPVVPPTPVVREKPEPLSFLKNLFKKDAPIEIKKMVPHEIAPVIPLPKKLVDKGTLEKAAPIKLDGGSSPKSRTSLADVMIRRKDSTRLAKIQEPSIQLEEVGRKAAAVLPPSSISLSPNRKNPRLADVKPVVGGSSSRSRSVAPVDVRSVNMGRTRQSAGSRSGSVAKGGSGSRTSPAINLAVRPSRTRTKSGSYQKLAAIPRAVRKSAQIAGEKKKETEITGPLSKRKIIHLVQPVYPGWAQSRDIEADVAIKFFVSPDGTVIKNRIELQMSSGYREMDRLAMEALEKWKFSPLSGGTSQKIQWGVITFRFRLD